MSAGPEGREAPRFETGVLVAVLLATLVYWLVQFEPFFVPNNDYPSFEATARSLAGGELPDSYQRMPVFPALMALVAPLLPGARPYLHAALVLNLLFSLGMALALFRLSSRLLGPGALLVAVLVLTSSQFQTAALQPLVEPSLGLFVVLAFLGLQARSPWQYAAAFAAALSRYEAALLIPVLVVANSWRDGRLPRHLFLGGLASSGVVAWAGLGALHGSGTSNYLAMMEGTRFLPELAFLERSIKEPFRGWYADRGWALVVFGVAFPVPLAAGIRRGLRDFPVEAGAMIAFWGLSLAAIVAFGIAKPRYVYPTQWIPILFFTAGTLDLADRAANRWLPRWPAPLRAAAAVGALGAGVLFAGRWAGRVVEGHHPLPLAADLLYLTACAATLVAGLAWLRGRRPLCSATAALAALALMLPLPAGAMYARNRDAFKIRYANYGTWLAARWARDHLGPDDGLVALAAGHIVALAELDPARVATFASTEARDPTELAEVMRRRGLTHVVYTARYPTTRSDRWFDARARADLARAFAQGEALPGYVHVATLTIPPEIEEKPVQIYRLEE